MLSFLDFVRHDLAFYSISRQMKDRRLYVAEQRKAAAEAAAIEDQKDKPSPLPPPAAAPDATQAQTAQTSHLPHAGVDTIDGGELVGKRRKGVRPTSAPTQPSPHFVSKCCLRNRDSCRPSWGFDLILR